VVGVFATNHQPQVKKNYTVDNMVQQQFTIAREHTSTHSSACIDRGNTVHVTCEQPSSLTEGRTPAFVHAGKRNPPAWCKTASATQRSAVGRAVYLYRAAWLASIPL
jgi:hypothetical protein